MQLEYECPNDGELMHGNFGANVTCPKCGTEWRTAFTSQDGENYYAWIEGEAKDGTWNEFELP